MSSQLTDKQYLYRLQACVLLRQQGYLQMAADLALDLSLVRDKESSIWHQKGQIFTATGDFNQDKDSDIGAAGECFREALRLLREHCTPETHMAQFQASALGYAQSLMRLGRFSEALYFFESGRLCVSWEPFPTTEYWDGLTENIPALLVQAEGGYGDIFMFMRWLPLLKSRKGVGRVGLMMFKSLADFCDWKALGVDEVFVIGEDKIRFGAYRYSCSIMSMLQVFNVQTWEDISDPGLLDPGTQCFWKGLQRSALQPTDSSFRLGFCWRAEENSSPIKTKSLDFQLAEDVTYLIAHDPQFSSGISIFSLSPDKQDLYNSEAFEQPALTWYEPARMKTFRDTAAYLCSMDFVLTCDTAVAHLCGLLGVPALVLVPRGGCWRWGTHDRTSGPWYGPQLTYYRQPEVHVWDAQDIVKTLMERINVSTAA